MRFARSLFALGLAALLTARAASAQTPPPPLLHPAPPTCAQPGAVTVKGRVPVPGRGQNVVLRIAPDSVETEALAKDMVAEIEFMQPLASHTSNLHDYATALAQIPRPQPSLEEGSFDALETIFAKQAEHRRMTALASNELADVAVGAKGEFTCRGVPAGSYLFLLVESEIAPPTAAQRAWGPVLASKTLYESRFIVPRVRKAATFDLRAPFTMVARFHTVGA